MQFVAWMDNGLHDYLSRFLMHKDDQKNLDMPHEIKCKPIQVHDVVYFLSGDQKLVQIWRYLKGYQFDTYLSAHSIRQLEEEAKSYILTDGCLMRFFGFAL